MWETIGDALSIIGALAIVGAFGYMLYLFGYSDGPNDDMYGVT